jgi:hypothetical protein
MKQPNLLDTRNGRFLTFGLLYIDLMKLQRPDGIGWAQVETLRPFVKVNGDTEKL